MRYFRSISLVLAFTTLSALAADRTRTVPAISPVPLWPANGDTSQLPKGQYVFYSPETGEYIVYYPSGTGVVGPENIKLRFGNHSLTDPQVTSHIEMSGLGQYRYSYSVANGQQARRGIEQVSLLAPDRTAIPTMAGQSISSSWKIERADAASLHDLADPQVPLVSLSWSVMPIGQPINAGASTSGFVATSAFRPGFVNILVRGQASKEYDARGSNGLPLVVKEQIAKVLSPTWDSQVRLTLGPRFSDTSSPVDVIQNFFYGISVLARHKTLDPNSPFVIGALASLGEYLKSGQTDTSRPESFAFLQTAKGDLETEIANAFRMSVVQ